MYGDLVRRLLMNILCKRYYHNTVAYFFLKSSIPKSENCKFDRQKIFSYQRPHLEFF